MHSKPLLTAVILSLLAPLANAADCGLAHVQPPLGATVTWTGPCTNGLANGTGVLQVTQGKTLVMRYEGDIRNGEMHGKGSLRRMDNDFYEGAFEHDNPHGFGVAVTRSGKYEGEWKQGQRNGKGKMTFAVGGQYDGEWKNNRFHGTGTARYISGREVTAQFVDGVRSGLPPVPKAEAKYKLFTDPVTGSHIRELAIKNGVVPFTRSYSEMSDAERATIRSWYPLLDDMDEPPYPIYGSAELYRAILEWTKGVPVRGTLHMLVDVDERGDATGYTVQATPDPELGRLVSIFAMAQKYKPGTCSGRPCAMKFPLSVSVGAKLGSTDDVR